MARDLILVLGDQLDLASAALDDVDPRRDVVVMIEAAGEATKVWSHQARIALFLAAMRHHAEALRARGLTVDYVHLDAPGHTQTLGGELTRAIARHRPARVIVVEPGEHDVAAELTRVAAAAAVPLEVRVDRHFLCSREDFTRHCQGRSSLRLEYFYRAERRRHRVLLEDDDQPVGGQWNFDADNRSGFGKAGPGLVPRPRSFAPDAITREVLALVARRFGDHPGSLAGFDWPVTAADATAALDDFIAHRLPQFGTYQDAMWTGQPILYHARIAAAMNLKLIAPRPIVDAAVAAHRAGRAPLAATEGFVRQILGWREYMWHLYWHFGPDYTSANNELQAHTPLPDWWKDLDADAVTAQCLRAALQGVRDRGWNHHIQRLMILGSHALQRGYRPDELTEWFATAYVDGFRWVMPTNVVGMSQHADGGLLATKPYTSGGAYINKMSDHCGDCAFDPKKRLGEDACPFTAGYWAFTHRHRDLLARNNRTRRSVSTMDRLSDLDAVLEQESARDRF